MQQQENIRNTNQLFFYVLIVFLFTYSIIVTLKILPFNEPFYVGALIFILYYYSLKLIHSSIIFKQYSLIIGMNVLILLLIAPTFYIVNLYSFIFYLFFIGLYFSSRILIGVSFVVLVEIFTLTIYYLQPEIYVDELPFVFWNIAAIIMMISFILLGFISYNWGKLEQANRLKQQRATSKNAYLQLFFEYANDAIAVFDLNNKIIAVNPAFEKLYGWSKEEAIGQSLPMVPPIREKEARDRFLQIVNGSNYAIESEELKKDGTIFHAQISLSPIYDRSNNIIACSVISKDISYQKEHERLVMQSEKLKIVGELAAGVAHEIRNPMTVISGFAQMMEQNESPLAKTYLPIVKDEIDRINLIISEFLVLSKPQIKEKELVDLAKIIQEISTFFEIEFQTRSIHFSFKNEVDQAFIYGNRHQIKQVIINLIKNSMEAIEKSGTITMIISQQPQGYLLTLKDDGCGIPEQILEKIFEPFYTTKAKGTGLGMMIINKIIQDHNGSIKVFSKEHVGTDIHIQFTHTQ